MKKLSLGWILASGFCRCCFCCCCFRYLALDYCSLAKKNRMNLRLISEESMCQCGAKLSFSFKEIVKIESHPVEGMMVALIV